MRTSRLLTLLAALLASLLVACSAPAATSPAAAPAAEAPTVAPTEAPTVAPTVAPAAASEQLLRLATTTSTADSGLLDAILPAFEEQFDARVEVIAVGTGQALALGEKGDVDVVLVHARSREDAFVSEGYGINRRDVMYNDFVLVGPSDDPAGVAGMTSVKEAFAAIAQAEVPFASRGDESGTHTKELSIWKSAAVTPTADLAWYKSLGQGMGETLITANELGAYTLTDRATWLAQRDSLPNLKILFGGDMIEVNPDQALYNPYGVIPVNPELHEGINNALAEQFAQWITSPETARLISDFGKDKFGQALFFPGTH